MTENGDTQNEISGGFFFSTVIQGRNITLQLPHEITPALSGLPAGTPAFIGRDKEMHTLLDFLAPTQGDVGDIPDNLSMPTVMVTAVGGLAGIGKTELAIQAAQAALKRGWFPGGVLFVDLFGYDPPRRVDPGQALEGFLQALAIPREHIPQQTQDRARLYTSVLAAYVQMRRPILVVIDNAATYEQVKPLLPATSVSAVIVTSRDTLGMLDAELLDLDILTPRNAAHMLGRAIRVRRPRDTRVADYPAVATRIGELCGGLPLALRIIAALLSDHPDRSLVEMVDELADERTRLDELSYADTAVRAAFDLSYKRLSPEHTWLFRLLAINTGPEISTQAAAELASLDQPTTRRILESLSRAHLLNHGSIYGRWKMHDLVRLYAQQLLDGHADADEREQARYRLLRYYFGTTIEASIQLRTPPWKSARTVFADRDSALTWLDSERVNLIAAVTMAASTGRDKIAIQMPFKLAEYFIWRGRFDDLLAISGISREAARRRADRANEASALHNIGVALWKLRRFEEAISAHMEAAAAFRESGDRHGEGLAMNGVGNILLDTRRFEEATRVYQNALAIFRETGDRENEGKSLFNLGSALATLRRFEDAISAQQDAMEIMREIGDQYNQGTMLSRLGDTLREARRFEEAVTTLKEAVMISRESGDRHGEAASLQALGVVLREVRRFEEAISAHRDAAEILREVGDRFSEGLAMTGLGEALLESGQSEEAIKALHDAVEIFRGTGDRYDEGAALASIAIALGNMRQFEEAATIHHDAIAIYRETEARHGEGKVLCNLGNALTGMGKYEEAIITLYNAVEILREIGDRYNEGKALSNLGRALNNVSRFDEALRVIQDSVAIYRETGDRHGEAQEQINLGVTLIQIRRPEEAIVEFQQAAAFYREIGDRGKESLALTSLGTALRDVGRYAESITTLQDSETIARETGDRNDEGNALAGLGLTLVAMQRPEEAIPVLQNAVAIFREMGNEHQEALVLEILELARTAQQALCRGSGRSSRCGRPTVSTSE